MIQFTIIYYTGMYFQCIFFFVLREGMIILFKFPPSQSYMTYIYILYIIIYYTYSPGNGNADLRYFPSAFCRLEFYFLHLELFQEFRRRTARGTDAIQYQEGPTTASTPSLPSEHLLNYDKMMEGGGGLRRALNYVPCVCVCVCDCVYILRFGMSFEK